MIYLSKGGAGADSDHMWIRPCYPKFVLQSNTEIQKKKSPLWLSTWAYTGRCTYYLAWHDHWLANWHNMNTTGKLLSLQVMNFVFVVANFNAKKK